MARPGPTTARHIERLAGNLVRLARDRAGLTQRALAEAAGVPQSTVARVEAGTMQPTLPLLYRLVAGAGLEPRVRLEPYDDHDDVLDRLAAEFPAAHPLPVNPQWAARPDGERTMLPPGLAT